MEQKNDFPPGLSQPVRRALANAGINSLQQLAEFPVRDIARLHGMGPKGIKLLQQALAANGLSFKP